MNDVTSFGMTFLAVVAVLLFALGLVGGKIKREEARGYSLERCENVAGRDFEGCYSRAMKEFYR